MKYYTIHYKNETIADEITKEAVVSKAEKYFTDKLQQSGFIGFWAEEVDLEVYDDENNTASTAKIDITLDMFDCGYDGGRFDYNTSRGV